MATTQQDPQTKTSHVGRRAFIGLATVAACGGIAAVAGPQLVSDAEQRIRDAERDAVLNELASLEGISLDAALRAAELTKAAVHIIVVPLARVVALIGAGALTVLLNSVDAARNVLSALHLANSGLDRIHDLLVTWRDSVSLLPVALDSYVTADIDSAEAYLRSLKAMVNRQKPGATQQ
jgi:hypothetical protein